MTTPHAAPPTPRGCRSCGRPFSAPTSFSPPLCPGCDAQARLSTAQALVRVRENLEALLVNTNSNTLLPLYQSAREGVTALVRLEGSGALAGKAAAWLARRMDDGRETVLSLALRQRMGTGGDPTGRRKLEALVRSFVKDLGEIGVAPGPDQESRDLPAPAPLSELRQHARDTVQLPVQMDPGARAVTSRDVSPGGAFVCCSPLPPVGQRLTLTFFAGEERRRTFARVRWATPDGVGVEFSGEQVGAPFGL